MSFSHLTLEERKVIEEALKKNWSLYKIAKKLGRHRSTIGREIKRSGLIEKNVEGKPVISYHADEAETQAQNNKRV